MKFRQLFDQDTGTYTYLLVSSAGNAVIIDPVIEKLKDYRQLLGELGATLQYALDTHTHADHVTALGTLRDELGCITVMGELTQAKCVSERVSDGDIITVDEIELRAIFTPGHTDESFSFYLQSGGVPAVFTGDSLLIRGTGRTDFQAGSPQKSWDSIVNKLFSLPDETLVYPGHDYKGWTVSSIGEEKQFNPRLAGKTEQEYIDIMNSLNLADPKMMDVAIPANLACGKTLF